MNEKTWLNNNQLAIDIWNKKYRYEDETFEQWLDRVSNGNEGVKRLIIEQKFLFGYFCLHIFLCFYQVFKRPKATAFVPAAA